ncbi:hypothetical protein ACET3Z_010195 [Daucus carota]
MSQQDQRNEMVVQHLMSSCITKLRIFDGKEFCDAISCRKICTIRCMLSRENVHLNTHVSDLGIGYRGPSIASAFQRQRYDLPANISQRTQSDISASRSSTQNR